MYITLLLAVRVEVRVFPDFFAFLLLNGLPPTVFISLSDAFFLAGTSLLTTSASGFYKIIKINYIHHFKNLASFIKPFTIQLFRQISTLFFSSCALASNCAQKLLKKKIGVTERQIFETKDNTKTTTITPIYLVTGREI